MEYIIHLAIFSSIFSLLAISLNLVVGYTGLLSVAHAAFYGIGAYGTAIFLLSYQFPFWAAVLLAMAVTALCALLIGIVMSKFRGDLYALASLGFNSIVFSIFLNWEDVTRGPLGIPGIPRPTLLGFSFKENGEFLLLCIIVLLLGYLAARALTQSSFGRTLKAIREDEQATQIFGYRTLYFKLAIFVIGACFASVAGSLYATYVSYIDPSTFTVLESIFILAMIILGGLANLHGAIIGAVFLVLLPELLRFVGFSPDIAAQMRQVVYGLLLILLMLYRPQGLFGEYKL